MNASCARREVRQMFDNVISAVLSWLSSANISAVEKFPETKIDRESAVVAVSIKSGVLTSSGAGNYLGIYDYGGSLKEVYGSRAELCFALDIYSPDSGTTAIFDEIAGAAPSLPDGLKLRSIECGSTEFDSESGMFCLKCEMKCIAILVRTETEEQGEFSDFVLRGEINGHEC